MSSAASRRPIRSRVPTITVRFRESAEKAGIGWAIWDWKAGFHYWNDKTGKPEPGMHEALFGRLVDRRTIE